MHARRGEEGDETPRPPDEGGGEAENLQRSIVEFADRWFRAVETDFYPRLGRKGVFSAIPSTARRDYLTWWSVITELVELVGPHATLSDITPEVLDSWIGGKMAREVERAAIAREINWLATLLDYAVKHQYVNINVLDNFTTCLSDDYRGYVPFLPVARKPKRNPVQLARSYKELMEREGCSATGLARSLGIPQSLVAKSLALLRLPSHLRLLVEQQRLAPSTALEIAKHRLLRVQEDLASRVLTGELRRCDVITYISRYPDGHDAEPDRSRCPVQLRGVNLPVIVMGLERPPIRIKTYGAIKLLADAWPDRIPLNRLEMAPEKGGAGATARHHLRKLMASEDAPWWREVIVFPGGPWKGYGLAWPATRQPGEGY